MKSISPAKFLAPGLLAWALLTCAPGLALAANWYVATTGSDLNPGTVDLPFATIQRGIDAAAGGDEVLVAAGTYSGDGNRDLDTGGKAIAVRGVAGSAATTIACGGTHDGFALAFSEEDSTTIIEGFTITSAVVGCDLLMAAPRLRDLVLAGATTAGVRFEWTEFKAPATPLVIEDCTFDGNLLGLRSWMPTGREYCQVRGCSFLDNATGVLGLVSMYGCTVTGGSVGVQAIDQVSDQLVVNCEISGVTGAVFAPDPEDAAALEVVGATIHDNPGDIVYARSIEAEYVTLVLADCVMVDNGGGIDVAGNFCDVTLDGCLYARNGAPVAYAGAPAAGGSFSCLSSTVVDCVGTGLEISSEAATIEIGNTIAAFNGGRGIDVPAATAGFDIHCCDVFGNAAGNYGTIADQTGLNGNISADPQFCDRPAGDYALNEASPCTAVNSPCGRIGREGTGCGGAAPSTWYVATTGSDGNPGTLDLPFATIGHGVAAAAAGDTVLVLDGRYVEHVAIGKALTLASLSGDTTACTIEAPPGYRVITVLAAADTVRIRGFELTGGTPAQGDIGGYDPGGGVLAEAAPLVLGECHIHGNTVPADQTHSAGGGVHVRGGAYLRLERCLVADNTAPRAGGVCIRHDAGADLFGNVIVRNHAGWNAAAVWILPDATAASRYLLAGNTIAANTLTTSGTAVTFDLLADLVLVRNIVAYNDCPAGQVGIYATQADMDCNIVYPPPRYDADVVYDAGGNVHAEPGFCDLAAGDFRLAATSPGAPENSGCGLIGALGVGCAIPSAVGDGPPPALAAVLHPPYPNPFNPRTTIAYDLPRAVAVDLTVYDVEGRLVRVLKAGAVEGPGRAEVVWRGRDDRGRALAAGTYVCRLQAGDAVVTRKVLLLK